MNSKGYSKETNINKGLNMTAEISSGSDYKICIHGALLDVGNLGCHALTISLISLVMKYLPNAKIYLLYKTRYSGIKNFRINGKTIEVRIVNCRLSPKARLNEHLFWILFMAFLYRLLPYKFIRSRICKYTPWIRVLKDSDFVGDISAGDSFSDIYGLQRILTGSIPGLIAILMNKKLVMLPQTYGPYRTTIARAIAKFILLKAWRIYARDKNSIVVIRRLLRDKSDNKSILFCPDVAFTLKSVRPNTIDINPAINRNDSKLLVGLNISGLLYNGGYTRKNQFGLKTDYKIFIFQLVEKILLETDCHILLVPHVFCEGIESDFDACREIFAKFCNKKVTRVHLIQHEYDQNEIKGLIGMCDFFIGSRLHSCIAALSQAIPCVGVAYSRKFLGIFESFGLADLALDARKKMSGEMIIKIIDSIAHRNDITEKLADEIPNIHRKIETCFENLF